MIDLSDTAADVLLSGGWIMHTRVESWRGPDLLDDDVPIASGTEDDDVTQRIPETIDLTVPVLHQGVTYAPGDSVDHPLAAWGQRLRIYQGVGLGSGKIEWVRRRWCYITDAQVDGDTVQVTASGLLGLIDEAVLTSPLTASGTYTSMIRRLVEPALTVDATLAPADRAVAAGVTFADNRLDAVQELLDTWPATAYVDEDGVLRLVPAGDGLSPLLDLTDGTGGTTMDWGTDVSRDGAASAVIARGYTAAGADVQALVYDTDPASPTWYAGPFNPLPVPYVYFSPLLTTEAECHAAAVTVLARRKAQAARRVSCDAVPYPALEARDPVTVTSSRLGLWSRLGIVDQMRLPLTADSGAMQLGVRLP